ncbi:MAG: type II toxin-antitoxin system RatA family toxin [Solirubrobacteraceae bacterium]
MGTLRGERTVEIDAPIQRVFEVAADLERAPEWQHSLRALEVHERDGDRRATTVDTESDAKVRTIHSRLRYVYEPPTRIAWAQERGDVKAVHGWWRLEDLGSGRTRATYGLEVDPGRMLGLLLRGPAEGRVRDFLLDGTAEGLKERAEAR